jgi:hypothetical protein
VHTVRPKLRSLIALGSAIALVALLTASTASARSLDGPRTATRGPAGVTNYKPRQSTPPSDFGWADGILVGGFLLALAVSFGYALSSSRGGGDRETLDSASPGPASSNGRPDATSPARRPATSRG